MHDHSTAAMERRNVYRATFAMTFLAGTRADARAIVEQHRKRNGARASRRAKTRPTKAAVVVS